jgi:hypothetical protein
MLPSFWKVTGKWMSNMNNLDNHLGGVLCQKKVAIY